jgi:putative protease
MDELGKIGSRGYTENFLSDPPDRHDMLYTETHVAPTHQPVGIVVADGAEPLIDIRNPLRPGQTIEYLGQGLHSSFHKVIKIITAEGEHLEKANPGHLVRLISNPPAAGWATGALLRKEV